MQFRWAHHCAMQSNYKVWFELSGALSLSAALLHHCCWHRDKSQLIPRWRLGQYNFFRIAASIFYLNLFCAAYLLFALCQLLGLSTRAHYLSRTAIIKPPAAAPLINLVCIVKYYQRSTTQATMQPDKKFVLACVG